MKGIYLWKICERNATRFLGHNWKKSVANHVIELKRLDNRRKGLYRASTVFKSAAMLRIRLFAAGQN